MVVDALVSRYRTQTPTLPPPVADHWEWQQAASCRNADASIFYPPNSSRGHERELLEAQAKSVCHTCPVQRQCLEHALNVGEPYGIWGATTPKERALLAYNSTSPHTL
ncbi:WhiB family transcriptional regulator [Williamsia muralis]|uniref:Transcriptional regulator WhiB n=1 Tax=Williamsia marianensis TaxID=85044 RepID=A0A2G3PMM2_WILMA|nr:WhiB family transcriptional regulator [Williamsia marianensis]PHV66983.1 transcription factor WhiB [Williamsia marianensis]